jgi:peptide-methionine (S)-S-oxide reductase
MNQFPRLTSSPTEPGALAQSEGELLDTAQRATFAAGCFWGVEAAFREIEGVLETSVGYIGGHVPNPTYELVCHHGTGHAEAVDMWFDPAKVSYAELLQILWGIHDPTTPNRQGWDFGDQYRSAIFFHDADQQALAISSRDDEQRSLSSPIVTEITAAPTFYRAEEYHQQFFEKADSSGACAVTLR